MPEDTNTQQAPAVGVIDISARLFANNSLLIVSKHCWGGSSTVKQGDEEIFGARQFDSNFFKRGGIVLIAKEHFEGFQKVINKLDGYMAGVGKTFLLRGICIIKNEEMPKMIEKIQECQAEMLALRTEFLSKYDDIAIARCRAFDEAHPEHAGRLNRYFPPTTQLRESFSISYIPFAITDSQGLDEVFEEGREQLRSVTSRYVDQMASEFRGTILEAVKAFKDGIETAEKDADGEVGKRKVTSFRKFLDKIEKNDFLGDTEMKKMLEDMKFGISRVDDWSAENLKSENGGVVELKRVMDSIIEVASNEASLSMVTSAYGFEHGSVDVELDVMIPDSIGGGRDDITIDAEVGLEMTEPSNLGIGINEAVTEKV